MTKTIQAEKKRKSQRWEESESPESAESRQGFRLLTLVFGISGAATLIYEMTWSRSLQFIFGSSEQAISTILAGLLLGFSVGAYIFRGIADRTVHPLRHLALLEAGISIYGRRREIRQTRRR